VTITTDFWVEGEPDLTEEEIQDNVEMRIKSIKIALK
jgi:hypothetical protein